MQVRLFGGRFLQSKPSSPSFVLGLSGSPDYRRQTAFYFDRQQISHALTAQIHQTDNRDGAFKAFMPVASTSWLSTLNLRADLPVTRLAVFADLGATARPFQSESTGPHQRAAPLSTMPGLVLPLLPGRWASFTLPGAGLTIRRAARPNRRQAFTDAIRFTIHLGEAEPVQAAGRGGEPVGGLTRLVKIQNPSGEPPGSFPYTFRTPSP